MSAQAQEKISHGAPQPIAEAANSSDRNPLAKIESQTLPSYSIYLGIFLTASAVLLFELALTRIFAVLLWSHLAFMVVGTALFGFALSGAYLALRPLRSRASIRFDLTVSTSLMGLTILGAYLTITNVPFRMWQFHEDPLNYLYLAVWYLALVAPFFLAGIVVAKLLSAYPARAARLYGVDLIGAACGSLLLIPVIHSFGGEGTVVFAAILAAAAGLFFSARTHRLGRVALIGSIIALMLVLPQADSVLPLKFHASKRRFNKALEDGHVFATRWSPISRVDVAYQRSGLFDIWIDAGTNESRMLRWSGNLDRTPPFRWSTIGAVFDLKRGTDPKVMIIGPAGGQEVLFAVSHRAAHVDAVEMDPSIVELVNIPKYAKFMGNLYQNERVQLINDEGRSFLRRQPPESYDVIQFVNNYTPVALASGALNLSETFLLTKEAFGEYLDRLTPDGVLALHRGATLRVALTAATLLRERGVKDPHNHMLITNGEVPFFEGFFLKKSAWTEDEVQRVNEYMQGRALQGDSIFLWNPFDSERENLFSSILRMPEDEQAKYYTSLGVNLFPTTDDRPFIEHFLQFGHTEIAEGLPDEFAYRNDQKWRGIIPRGDFPYYAILAESALLALVFVVLPLVLSGTKSNRKAGFGGFLGYFAGLGFGFIVIEICLMKRYILFLGNPAYSITTVLVVLLLGAGLGSLFTSTLKKYHPRAVLTFAIPAIALALAFEALISPLIFQTFLGLEFGSRVFVASLLLLPLGFLMGMPFPLGLQLINLSNQDEIERRKITAWAWGMNGYTTVIGSALSVFIALYAGFKVVLLVGIAVYLLALLSIRHATRSTY